MFSRRYLLAKLGFGAIGVGVLAKLGFAVESSPTQATPIRIGAISVHTAAHFDCPADYVWASAHHNVLDFLIEAINKCPKAYEIRVYIDGCEFRWKKWETREWVMTMGNKYLIKEEK